MNARPEPLVATALQRSDARPRVVVVGAGFGGLACVKALATGWVPPTINLDSPDPDCDLDYVPWKTRQVPIRTAMANGFGFGGQNSVAVFKKWEGD